MSAKEHTGIVLWSQRTCGMLFPRRSDEGSTVPAVKELIILWGPSHRWLTGKHDWVKQGLAWGTRDIFRGPTEGHLILHGRNKEEFTMDVVLEHWQGLIREKAFGAEGWMGKGLKCESARHKEWFREKQNWKGHLGWEQKGWGSPWRVWNFFCREQGVPNRFWVREWYEIGYAESLYVLGRKH